MKKLGAFLEKIEFFETLLSIAWSVCIIYGSFAVDRGFLVFYVPEPVWIILLLTCILAGVFLQRRHKKNPDSAGNRIGFQAFYFGIPVAIMLIRAALQDELYHFAGGFMPGMDALGLFVINLALGGVAIIGWIVYGILRLYRKKKERSKSPETFEWWKKTKYVMNYVIFFGVHSAIAVIAIGFGVQCTKDAILRREAARRQEYLESRLVSLVEDNLAKDRKDAEEKVLYEGFTCGILVETLEKGQLQATSADPGPLGAYSMAELTEQANNLLAFSNLTEDIFVQGMEQYGKFISRYSTVYDLVRIGSDIVGDPERKTVSVSSQFEAVDDQNREIIDAYLITVFDENWNVVRLYCSRDPLVR